MNKSTITLKNQQTLAYQTYGQGQNPVILYHGLVGGSWLSDELIAKINGANITVYAIERVGYGHTSQIPMNQVADWCQMIQSFFETLAINKADVIGISAGAPYAYATAEAFPEVIGRIWILCGVPAVYEDNILAYYKKEDQLAYKKFLRDDFQALQAQYKEQMQNVLSYYEKNGVTYITKILEEVIAQDCYGMAQESRLQIKPWGLNLKSIQQPISIYHAPTDEMVPFEAAAKMVKKFRQATFIPLDLSGDNVHINTSVVGLEQVLKYYLKEK